MTTQPVEEAFRIYEERIRVPSAQNRRAKEVHPTIRAVLEEKLGSLFLRAFLAGSYARRVQTIRLNDIDIVVVLNDPTGEFLASARLALTRLGEAASNSDLVIGTDLGRRSMKLTIDGEEFTVDLVGALNDLHGELLLARHIPEEGLDDWTPARPQGQLDAFAAKNKTVDGSLPPSVRTVKSWNQKAEVNGKNAMPSYLAESILFGVLDGPLPMPSQMLAFFRAAEQHLSTAVPTVPCPGDPGNFVDERLDEDRRLAALQRVQAALPTAEAAHLATDASEAIRLWASVFGPAFPVDDDEVGSLAAALQSGTAAASGTAVTSAPTGRRIIPARSWRTSG